MINLSVNGVRVQVNVSPDTPLLWVLRDHFNLTGTKYGCGISQCGACTVHLHGKPIRACVTPISTVQGGAITTIEGLNSKISREVQNAWKKLEVVQCGYCQSGQIMAAVSLLNGNKSPTDTDIDSAMNGNLCRCATYQRIREAIKEAAKHIA